MPFCVRALFFACAISSVLALSGCLPGQNSSDEEKEPHFVLGQSRVNAMDYQGAIEAFEESLEVNPRSAQAHYQLAMLYDTKVPDPAAAIYHYRQYLKFDPDAPNAVIVKQRIEACKEQLAADVLALPASSATQQQLEKLIEENRELQDEVNKWRAYYASQMAAAKTNPPENNFIPQTQNIVSSQNRFSQTPRQSSGVKHTEISVNHAGVASPRTHTVVAGETAAAISRRYNIRLGALETANPDVNLSRIRVGQILKIP